MKRIDESSSFEDVAEMIAKIFGINGIIGLTYFIATLFKKEIIQAIGHFPILNINGNMATGKSQLAKTISSFGKDVLRPMDLTDLTSKDIFQSIKENPESIVTMDGYSNRINKKLYETLTGLDGTNEFLTWGKKRIELSEGASVILTGKEIPTKDYRLLTRSVCITMDERIYDKKERRNFLEFCNVRNSGFNHFREYIKKQCNINAENFYQKFDLNMFFYGPGLLKDIQFDESMHIVLNWMLLVTVFEFADQEALLPGGFFNFHQEAFQRMNIQTRKYREITK